MLMENVVGGDVVCGAVVQPSPKTLVVLLYVGILRSASWAVVRGVVTDAGGPVLKLLWKVMVMLAFVPQSFFGHIRRLFLNSSYEAAS